MTPDDLDRYAEYLCGLGLAPGTVRMYRSCLGRAIRWADATGVDLIAPKATELADLRKQFPESSATLRQVRCALTHYWDMLQVTQPPVKALRVPAKPTPHWRGLPDTTARALASTSVGWHPEGTATLIGLYTGMRRSEIASVRWDRFDPALEWYTVLGKGGYTDTVPVHPALRAILRPLKSGYLWLFPGERRLHVNPATVWEWVRRVADEAGVNVTTHQLRHTAVNKVYQATRDIRVAQRFARHRRVDTTQLYTHVTDDQVLGAVESLDWLTPGPIRRAA